MASGAAGSEMRKELGAGLRESTAMRTPSDGCDPELKEPGGI